MQNISDIIEEFIISTMGGDNHLDLSRNDLAGYFGCAPSQINYVLSTRFTEPKGFVVESHRGGGGYIKLERLNIGKDNYIGHLIANTLSGDIDYHEGLGILNNLYQMNLIDKISCELLGYAISPKALAMPIRIENRQRANILKNVLINMIRGIN